MLIDLVVRLLKVLLGICVGSLTVQGVAALLCWLFERSECCGVVMLVVFAQCCWAVMLVVWRFKVLLGCAGCLSAVLSSAMLFSCIITQSEIVLAPRCNSCTGCLTV